MRFGTLKVMASFKVYWEPWDEHNYWIACIFALAAMIFQMCGIAGYIFYSLDDPEKSLLTSIGVGLNYVLFIFLFLAYLSTMKDVALVIRQADNLNLHEFNLKFSEEEKLPEETRLKILVYVGIPLQLLVFSLPILQICERGDDSCGLTYNAYYGFDIYYTPVRQLTTLFQALSSTYNCTISCLLINVFISLTEFLIHDLTILKDQLQYLRTIERFAIRREHLKKCIKYHIQIIDLVEYFDKISSRLLYVLFVWPIGIDFALYSALVEFENIWWVLPTIIVALGALTVIFNFGQQLTDKSILISETAYDVMPFDGDNELCKDLMVVSMRAQKPVILHIGAFGELSNPTYLAMLKFCYTVMTALLNQMGED